MEDVRLIPEEELAALYWMRREQASAEYAAHIFHVEAASLRRLKVDIHELWEERPMSAAQVDAILQMRRKAYDIGLHTAPFGEPHWHLPRVERFLYALKQGMTEKDAARMSGLPGGAVGRWLERGRTTAEEPFRTLAEQADALALKRVLRATEVVDEVMEQGSDSTRLRAAEKVLEWEKPEKYSPKSRQEVTVGGRVEVAVEQMAVFASMTAEDIAKLLEARRQAAVPMRPVVDAASLPRLLSGEEE